MLAALAVAALAVSVLGLDPDVGKGMVDIAIERGYTSIESHYVTTEVRWAWVWEVFPAHPSLHTP